MINKILLLLMFFSICENTFLQERIRIKPTLPTVNNFLTSPFGFETSKNNFSKNNDQWKMKIYTTKLTSNQAYKDTFFDFSYKKSRIVFLKVNKNEQLFSGVIETDNLKFINDIKIGMSRYEFFRSFSDLKTALNDTIRLENTYHPNYFSFIFKDSKLCKINIGIIKPSKKK